MVGGGDSATEEAVYLTKYAKHVSLTRLILTLKFDTPGCLAAFSVSL